MNSSPFFRHSLGDRFLAQFRRRVRSTERRHAGLPWLALAADLLCRTPPLRPPVRLNFPDGSTGFDVAVPIGLAAGANKTALHLASFAALGFGAVTVGSATLRPRHGNPHRPRAEVLDGHAALRNAMGLPNPGVEVLVRRLRRARPASARRHLALGLSVAEDPGLPKGADCVRDTLDCLREALGVADFVEINLSCPNTGHARLDGDWGRVRALVEGAAEVRRAVAPRVPVLVKLSPDLAEDARATALEIVARAGLSGMVLSNTWPVASGTWPDGSPLPLWSPLGSDGRMGGLSGRPLWAGTLSAVRQARALELPLAIWASGGVENGDQMARLLDEGVSLVQIYSVLAFRWLAAHRIFREYEWTRTGGGA